MRTSIMNRRKWDFFSSHIGTSFGLNWFMPKLLRTQAPGQNIYVWSFRPDHRHLRKFRLAELAMESCLLWPFLEITAVKNSRSLDQPCSYLYYYPAPLCTPSIRNQCQVIVTGTSAETPLRGRMREGHDTFFPSGLCIYYFATLSPDLLLRSIKLQDPSIQLLVGVRQLLHLR